MGHYKRSMGLPAERQITDALIYIANELHDLNDTLTAVTPEGRLPITAVIANEIKEGFDRVCDHLTMIQP